MPSLSTIIINERDEYIAQTLCEVARIASTIDKKNRTIVAVVGAGHLPGIKKWLLCNGTTDERIAEISSSSKQPSTWPGKNILQVVNTNELYGVQVSK